jgi:hypothetical protein
MGRVLDRHVLERHAPVGRVRADPAVMIDVMIVGKLDVMIDVTADLATRHPIVPVVAPTIGRVPVEALVVGPVVRDASIDVMTGATTGGTIVVGRHRGPVRVVSHLVRLVTKTGRRRTRPRGAEPQCALVEPVRFAKVSSRHESSALRRSGSTRAQCVRLPSRRPNVGARRRRLRSVETSNVPENLRPMWRPRSTTSSNHVVRPA